MKKNDILFVFGLSFALALFSGCGDPPPPPQPPKPATETAAAESRPGDRDQKGAGEAAEGSSGTQSAPGAAEAPEPPPIPERGTEDRPSATGGNAPSAQGEQSTNDAAAQGTGSGNGSGTGSGGGSGAPPPPDSKLTRPQSEDEQIWQAAVVAVRGLLKQPERALFPEFGNSAIRLKRQNEFSSTIDSIVMARRPSGEEVKLSFRCSVIHISGVYYKATVESLEE